MRVLTVVNQREAGPGVFADAAAAGGAELVEWAITEEPAPAGRFEAALVLGGAAHPDQDEQHGWIPREVDLLRGLVADRVPLLGVCLGAELLARALGARIGPVETPEIGWHDVELLPGAADDPVLGPLPPRFLAFQWHSYGFELPTGAVALARSPAALQAFRHGDRSWALQFHPEVTAEIVDAWLAAEPVGGLRGPTRRELPRWNELGRGLFARFLRAARSLR